MPALPDDLITITKIVREPEGKDAGKYRLPGCKGPLSYISPFELHFQIVHQQIEALPEVILSRRVAVSRFYRIGVSLKGRGQRL